MLNQPGAGFTAQLPISHLPTEPSPKIRPVTRAPVFIAVMLILLSITAPSASIRLLPAAGFIAVQAVFLPIPPEKIILSGGMLHLPAARSILIPVIHSPALTAIFRMAGAVKVISMPIRCLSIPLMVIFTCNPVHRV